MNDDSHVPDSPEKYLPTVHGFKDAVVDVADPRYKSAAATAHKARLSQGQFSQMLGFEASRVPGQSKAAAPAAAAPVCRSSSRFLDVAH